MRVAIIDDFQEAALSSADWSAVHRVAEVNVFPDHLAEPDALVRRLRPYEIVVVMRERTPLPRAVLERLDALRLIVTTGAANAAIDLDACAQQGITVCGTTSLPGATVEHSWALILAAARRLDIEVPAVRAGRWMAGRGAELGITLRGRTLGVLGLGRVGREVARVGRAFGMEVIAWSQHLTAERAAEGGARLVGKEQLFSSADVLTIHVQLSERTRGLVGAAELALMKPTAWLVNTSRGPICDEDALVRACVEGGIAGAALDVFSVEPLPQDSPLRSTPNIIATPHLGYATRDAYAHWYREVVQDILAFVDGAPLRVIA